MDRCYTVSVKSVSRHSDSRKMNNMNNNSEAAFTLSSVMEFIKVWRVGNESSLTLKCKDGRASINFHCNLGRPDQAHTQDGRQRHQKVKKKSASRVLKNNARAARHQAATRSFLPPRTTSHIIKDCHQPCSRPTTSSSSSEDQIAVNFLSVFRFSREK